MNESYKDLKAYLLNEIAEDAQDMLNAIGDKDVDEIDDEEVLCFCHSIATMMTALETVAMVAQEVWVDPDHRVDFVAFSPGSGGRNAALEHGKFVFVEVKSCMADFKSGHGLTFLGDENWLVCPRDLAHELYDERLLPFGVQVYCPDNGGALRLTYDLRMQAAKSLREDSTLCLLWAMLMDSYSRWRTTWDVFNETGESYDL